MFLMAKDRNILWMEKANFQVPLVKEINYKVFSLGVIAISMFIKELFQIIFFKAKVF